MHTYLENLYQERVTYLAILSTEYNVVNTNIDQQIFKIGIEKSRKVMLKINYKS